MVSHRTPPPRSSADGSNGRVSPTTGFAGGMEVTAVDPIVGANTPISQRRKGAVEVTADEATLSPQQERFMLNHKIRTMTFYHGKSLNLEVGTTILLQSDKVEVSEGQVSFMSEQTTV